ncbi:SDR family NAD(P)-dependent oxidoreductase [Actinomadura algeriensis]|uniref:NAD(P)-dependent dehydrogenase (Short-subunit alcohol dehydrogenase family) n=1 Tax=Actinomadura algeriensis TaxID=1679523 RepID=A0ABR9K324_9ACTN|nr:SDR family oxidoreductase [Actinomadura algeriensis]MBE1537222.1 NAD(P)-dependent dehydrogenase (short-subunit alcohol dehydrogenase family) [Actinomadura algeriensis]
MSPVPSRVQDDPPDGTDAPAPDELAACLALLDRARLADPDDPRWRAVHDAASLLHRAGKKARKRTRRTDRRRTDLDTLASTARHRDQNPSPNAAPVLPPGPPPTDEPPNDTNPGSTNPGATCPVGALPRGRKPGGTSSGETAPEDGVVDGSPDGALPGGGVGRLRGGRRCYVCKVEYREVHPEYHMLCPGCARENAERRHARCDLRGRRALVTGGRVKIGFHVALKMLRDGAEVMVTTRFPRDAARRFAAVDDSGEWLDRLHVHGVDLLDLPGVAGLLEAVHGRFDHLDVLVNNAAQTIRRPAAYHWEVRAAEALPLDGPAARVAVAEGVRGETALAPPHDALFPAGRTDETGEPLDLRDRNSWSLRLHEVDPAEWLEVQLVNAFAPFLLTSRLRGLLEASPWPDRYVVQVSAMEGSFSRANKTVRHPHTNMAKAALNMMTRTSAADYAASGVHMTSVDTGWVTDERPHPDKAAQRAAGFRPPLDVIDGAARVYDPVVRGVRGERMSGLFLKDYRPVEW